MDILAILFTIALLEILLSAHGGIVIEKYKKGGGPATSPARLPPEAA
jgi:hypothetical protein